MGKCVVTLIMTMALAVILTLASCAPSRPARVPNSAVFVQGAKQGWWEECTIDSSMSSNRCSIYGSNGVLIIGGEFKPYDGGAAVPEDQLTIDPRNSLSSVHRICLKNGRILLPIAVYEQERAFLDDIFKQRSSRSK